MTTPHLLDDLKLCEGRCLTAYPDPGTGSSPWTIGYGHTGLEVHPGLEWTEEQAEDALRKDVQAAETLLDRWLRWWRKLSDPRQDVLVQLMFNMGWGDGKHGLSSFKNTLAFIEAGDFDRAAVGLLASRWATQVKSRAKRLADQLRTGQRP